MVTMIYQSVTELFIQKGHFMAYEFIGSEIIRVFDPAHKMSRYSGHLNRNLISKLSGRRVVVCRAQVS